MKPNFKLSLDNLGICTSGLCAIHCLVTPFLIVLLPFAGLSFLEGESFEIGILVLSLFFAIASLVISYFRNHKNALPMILAGVGFVSFFLGKSIPSEEAEIGLSVIGGVFVVAAHYRNRKLIKRAALQ